MSFLQKFADTADEWFGERLFVEDNYRFLQAFFQPENLRKAEWEDFQEMGRRLHALSTHQLAYKNAFGNPNHPIDHYRTSFEYFARGDDPLPTRLNRIEGDSEQYGIKYLSESSIGELAGQLFAEDYLVYNQRSQKALTILGLDPEYERGETFGERFVKFTEAAEPVVKAYEEEVGARTEVPVRLEVDQFLSWLYVQQKATTESEVSKPEPSWQAWLIAPGRRAKFWDEFRSRGLIGIGWDGLGDLRQYPSRSEMENQMRDLYGKDSASAVDARACNEFAHEMSEGDVVVAKKGTTGIVGVGVVESAYRFDENRDRYRHVRDVRWIRVGSWTTAPRSRPRSDWKREKKEAEDWRSEPRILPRKTLTEISQYPTFLVELEILLGIDAAEAAGFREPLPVNEEVLDGAVGEVIRPLIEEGAFDDPAREGYIRQKVIPGAQKHLIEEAIAEDPVGAVQSAFGAHGNLLHPTEISKAVEFIREATPDNVRQHVEDLLRGDDGLVQRTERFLEWGGRRPGPEGQSIGFNGTAVSYLLATDNPAVQAFCKPTVYQAATEALLGLEHVVPPNNEAKRIAHATRLYGAVARRLRERHDLPIRDLFHVHTAFYVLADSPHYEMTWEGLRANGAREPNYYWLNCNPEMWDPRDLPVDGRNTYTARTEEGGKRRVYEHFEEIRPGDLLIGYVTSPVQRIGGLFRATRGLHQSESGRRKIEFQKAENIEDGPTRDELVQRPELSDSTPLRSRGGSLFRLSKAEFAAIRNEVDATAPTYTVEEATADLFYEAAAFRSWLDLLQHKRNIILQGPPGVGKTFVAKRLAFALVGRKDESRVDMVQFHQSYAYEDFIRGYRPDPETGGFRLQDGVFYRFCKKAKGSAQPHVFIIDEINRGNLSKIFGELMMLIEPDKRGPEHQIPLAYQREGEEKFYVPENVHIIGMMNTADRSLAMVDYALRRRFGFVSMEPRFDSPTFRDLLRERGAEDGLVDRIVARMGKLNERIAGDDTHLGPGFQIGHSYFCPDGGTTPDEEWYRRVIDREIAPLLLEYWFDDRDRAEREIKALKS